MAINREQAITIARRRLTDECGHQMVILDDAIVEREFGWVFLSASEEFLRTGDPNTSIPGVGPLVVNRADGSTEFLGTSGPPEMGIDIYEQKWRSRPAAG